MDELLFKATADKGQKAMSAVTRQFDYAQLMSGLLYFFCEKRLEYVMVGANPRHVVYDMSAGFFMNTGPFQ
ncbi:MAG TPA: hypothetical protein VHL77_10860 [Ferruginibacter sp.]|jgi:hypothetical protein|nr:hypothetical protein [Ferruginibacter sp.]